MRPSPPPEPQPRRPQHHRQPQPRQARRQKRPIWFQVVSPSRRLPRPSTCSILPRCLLSQPYYFFSVVSSSAEATANFSSQPANRRFTLLLFVNPLRKNETEIVIRVSPISP